MNSWAKQGRYLMYGGEYFQQISKIWSQLFQVIIPIGSMILGAIAWFYLNQPAEANWCYGMGMISTFGWVLYSSKCTGAYWKWRFSLPHEEHYAEMKACEFEQI